jgi:cytochrome bd-type quinol oxidase subunit 2
MAETIYLLCAATSLCCAILLIRAFRRGRSRLLLWSSACFALLALNNGLLVVDLILVKHTDLAIYRSATALAAVLVLLVGLIWEKR